MKSVGLTRLLNSNKKLVKSEVEETEDLIREVKAEIFRENWLKAEDRGQDGPKNVEKTVKRESDVQNNEEEKFLELIIVIGEKSVESDVHSPNAQNDIPETPNANKDFTEESLKKLHLSPIMNKLEQDEKDTGDDEKEEGKNDTEEGTTDIEKEKEEDEVNSDAEKSNEPNTNSPGKTENAKQSPVNAVHNILVGGASADLVDNEEDR